MFNEKLDRKYAERYTHVRKIDDYYWSVLYKEIQNVKKDSRLLDIGCANGDFITWTEQKRKIDCIGIDKSMKMLSVINKNSRNSFVLGDANDLPFRCNSFDVVIMNNVLHLIGLKKCFIDDIYRLLSKDGIFIIGAINVDELSSYWEYEFFPSAFEIDFVRMPEIDIIVRSLCKSNFKLLQNKSVLFEKRKFDLEFIERVKHRHMSSLWLISESEFDNGVKKLEESIHARMGEKQSVYLNILKFQK